MPACPMWMLMISLISPLSGLLLCSSAGSDLQNQYQLREEAASQKREPEREPQDRDRKVEEGGEAAQRP